MCPYVDRSIRVLTKAQELSYYLYMQQGIGIKPGIATSEFWSTIVTTGIGILVMLKVLPTEQALSFQNDLLQFINLVVQLFTVATAAYVTIKPVVTYIQGRVKLKSQLLSQQLGIVK